MWFIRLAVPPIDAVLLIFLGSTAREHGIKQRPMRAEALQKYSQSLARDVVFSAIQIRIHSKSTLLDRQLVCVGS